MKPQKKITNERAFEYDISVSFPFPAVSISKPQSMGMLWSAGN
jgi:hypothetical protein